MALHQFLDSSAIAAAVERLGWVLVHSLWQFAAVAAVVATALWLARRSAPAVRHGLLLGGLVAFVALRRARCQPPNLGNLASSPDVVAGTFFSRPAVASA